MFQKFAIYYSTVSNLRQYGQQLHNIYYYFILIFSLFITDISLSVFSSLSSLFVFHSTPITNGHHLTPLTICLLYSASGSFIFPFCFFPFMFFGCGLMDGLGNGWVRMGKLVVGGFGGYSSGWVEFHGLWDMAVGGLRWADRWWVGYGSGWVEMVMGRSVVVGGSTGDGRISDGESMVVPISVLICFCLCFSVLVVDSAAVVG